MTINATKIVRHVVGKRYVNMQRFTPVFQQKGLNKEVIKPIGTSILPIEALEERGETMNIL